MQKESGRAWIFLVLTMLGIAAFPRSDRPPAVAASPASAGPGEPVAGGSRHEVSVRLLNDAARTAEPGAPTTLAEFRASFLAQGARALRAVVVTVPDPERTNLARYFDQTVDAVLTGASASGFKLDRFWLPWKGASAARETKSQGCCEGSGPAPSGGRGDEPGVMVLRRQSAGAHELLVVLLAGESPVSGLQADTFSAAVDQAYQLSPGGLQILGPFFSGSALSLSQILEPWMAQHREVPVVIKTGSATNPSIDGMLARNLGPAASFSRTVATDRQLLDFLLQQLEQRDRQGAPRIAVLAEADTTFGDFFLEASSRGTTGAPARSRIKTFRFPLHIAQVRAAHDRKEGSDPKGPSAAGNIRRTLELRFDAAEDGGTRDTLPVFSGLSPFDAELTLRQTLTAISRQRFPYLAIAATDAADRVFLAREARKYCPGVELVTFGSDVLFTHPDLLSELSGMMVVSSYPLFAANQSWTSDDPARQMFAGQAAQGVHNALVLLLLQRSAEPAAGQALASARPCARLREYAPPGGGPLGPQLWLTVVAHGGFWPMATAPATPGDPELADRFAPPDRCVGGRLVAEPTGGGNGKPRPRVYPTTLADGVALLISLGSAAQLIAFLAARRRRTRAGFMGLFTPVSPRHELVRAQYLAAAFLALALLSTLVAVPAWMIAAGSDSGWRIGFTAVGTAIAVCSWMVAGRFGFQVLYRLAIDLGCWYFMWFVFGFPPATGGRTAGAGARLQRWTTALGALARRQWHPNLVALLVSILMLAETLAVLDWLRHVVTLKDVPRLLLLTRIADPLGLSPLSPLAFLALGLYFWSICGLRRVRSIERFPDCSPFPEEPDIATVRLSDLLSQLGGAWRVQIWWFELLVSALFVVPACFFWRHVHHTFEGPGFDLLFKATFVLLYGAIVFAFVHFVVLARLLQALLRRVAGHPMASAYDRIALKVSSSFGVQLRARVADVDELEVSARVCEALASIARRRATRLGLKAGPIGASSERLASAAAETHRAVECMRSQKPGDPSSACSIDRARGSHETFFRASQTIFRVLIALWRDLAREPKLEPLAALASRGDLLRGGKLAEVPTSSLLTTATDEESYLWTRMAEEFVAMRVATFVHHVVFQIRELLSFTLIGSLALTISVLGYRLHPVRFVNLVAWVLVLTVVAGGLLLIIRLERNEILSRLSGSTPGRVTLNANFLTQIGMYVLLPLALAVATLFPEVGDLILSWMGPLLRVVS